MSTDIDVNGDRGDLLTDAAPSGDNAMGAVDFLKDVRRVKRLTQIGVYSAIFAALPFHYLVLGLSTGQLLAVLAIGLVIASTAIEGALAEMFKLRKRSAYPGAVALQLGALPTFDAACQTMQSIMDRLLHLRASFLTLQNEGGFFSLVAISNLSRVDADRYLRLGAGCIQQALSSREPVGLRPNNDLLAGALPPRGQIVFVPVQSFQRVIVVIWLVGD